MTRDEMHYIRPELTVGDTKKITHLSEHLGASLLYTSDMTCVEYSLPHWRL